METDRLVLREIEDGSTEDAERLVSLFSEETVLRCAPALLRDGPHGMEEYRRRYTREKDFLKQQAFLFMVLCKETNDFVGICCFDLAESSDFAAADPRRNTDMLVQTYVGKRFRGKGYMAEALHELLPFVFYILGAERVYASCMDKNIRAQRLFLKSGFRALGAVDDGRRKKSVTFVLCRDQFRWGSRYVHPSRRT